jgi:hypothetical protein
MRIPFTIQSYTHESLPLSAQRLVNYYAEQAPTEAKSPAVLLPSPGLELFSTVGTGPIRAVHQMAEVLYTVSGSSLFSIDPSGTPTDLGSVGTTSSGLVSAANNGTELVVVNDNDGYVYDKDADTLTQITDPDFPAVAAVSQLDGYHLYPKVDSDQWIISNLRDATAYDALDFATAEGDPDTLLSIHVDHRQALLMGRRSIEPWYNSGETFPFNPVSGAFINTGLGARYAVANLDNTTFWLGNDSVVYRLNGFVPQRISTHAIEQAIKALPGIGDARAFGMTWKGHAFFVLTFPDQATFVFDAATGLWHERESYGQKGWLACCHARVYDNDFVGDQNAGKIYKLKDVYDDAGDPIRRIAAGAPLYANGDWAFMPSFEAIFESGVGTSGQGENPQAMLRYSDDGGRTWSKEMWRSIGKTGEYRKRTVWRRLGRFKERVVEVTVSDPVAARFIGANADLVGQG